MTVSIDSADTARRAPDRASDVLRATRHPLDALFRPSSVAVIGATEKAGSVGRTILWNLISSPFGGTVYPGQPEAAQRAGHQGLPEHRRRARAGRPGGHRHARRRRCPASSASASTAGVQGRDRHLGRLQGDRAGRARSSSGRSLERGARGRHAHHRPELPGRDEPAHRAERDLRRAAWRGPGNVGFISQSGALCTAILDWSLRENVGFSAFVSIGSMLDVGWGDLIDYLGDDPHTKSIVIYMESIGDARVVPLGGARSGADQADHRHQGRAAPRRRPRRRPRTPAR